MLYLFCCFLFFCWWSKKFYGKELDEGMLEELDLVQLVLLYQEACSFHVNVTIVTLLFFLLWAKDLILQRTCTHRLLSLTRIMHSLGLRRISEGVTPFTVQASSRWDLILVWRRMPTQSFKKIKTVDIYFWALSCSTKTALALFKDEDLIIERDLLLTVVLNANWSMRWKRSEMSVSCVWEHVCVCVMSELDSSCLHFLVYRP